MPSQIPIRHSENNLLIKPSKEQVCNFCLSPAHTQHTHKNLINKGVFMQANAQVQA